MGRVAASLFVVTFIVDDAINGPKTQGELMVALLVGVVVWWIWEKISAPKQLSLHSTTDTKRSRFEEKQAEKNNEV
ncbi:MAG: hypothetical protein ACXABY_14085 [Candidatus Thorarchaeota archaeon]|jgi:hypothetical protein